MKQLSYLLLCLILLPVISCNHSSHIPDEFAVFDDSVCYIKFEQKVNGYDVKVRLSPYECWDSIIGGVAEIAFMHGDTLRMLFHNPYFKLKHLDRKSILNGEVYTAEYSMPDIDYSKPFDFRAFDNVPFFFLDVNFDGQPELILNYANQEQRWNNAFVAYGLMNFGDGDAYDYLYDEVRNVPPFQNMDDLTEIDYAQNTISTLDYGGYTEISTKRIYRKINDQIQLYSIEELDSFAMNLMKKELIRQDTIILFQATPAN